MIGHSREPSAADLLFTMRKKGVKLWAEDGQLHFRAAKGVLTADEIQTIRQLKAEIIDLFQRTSSSDGVRPALGPRLPSERVPLTFSQQLWWRCLDLERRPSMRGVAAAARLVGQLNVDALQQSFKQLFRRHEALRTRIVSFEGIPIQHIDEESGLDMEVVDLSRLTNEEQSVRTFSELGEIVYERFLVAAGPLFAFRLLKLSDHEHVLAIAMDHIVSDAASIGILWSDLFTVYSQSNQGHPLFLPDRSLQFADYAVWQQKTHGSWIREHGGYWRKYLSGAPRVRLSNQDARAEVTSVQWGKLRVQCAEGLSNQLRTLCRKEKTTLAMATLSAYVACICRWCGISDLVVAFITAGRLHPEVERTVGYFGGPLFLRMRLLETDSFLDLLRCVTEEYARAYEHSDLSYVSAQTPMPEFLWNPRFNWIPQELNMHPRGKIEDSAGGAALSVEPFAFEPPTRNDITWEGELELYLSDKCDGVAGSFNYRADRFTPDIMERFARNFLLFAEQLVSDPTARVAASSCGR